MPLWDVVFRIFRISVSLVWIKLGAISLAAAPSVPVRPIQFETVRRPDEEVAARQDDLQELHQAQDRSAAGREAAGGGGGGGRAKRGAGRLRRCATCCSLAHLLAAAGDDDGFLRRHWIGVSSWKLRQRLRGKQQTRKAKQTETTFLFIFRFNYVIWLIN